MRSKSKWILIQKLQLNSFYISCEYDIGIKNIFCPRGLQRNKRNERQKYVHNSHIHLHEHAYALNRKICMIQEISVPMHARHNKLHLILN